MDIIGKIQKVVFDADISEYTCEFEKLFPELVSLTNARLYKESLGQLSLTSHGGSIKFQNLWDSKGRVLLGEQLGDTESVKYTLITPDLFLSFTYVPNQDKVWYLTAKQGDVFVARNTIQGVNEYAKQEIEKLKWGNNG